MNTINMPGFTAASSLYRTSGHYQMTASFDANGGVVQQVCDADCLGECQKQCVGLTGREHADCVIGCSRECGCIQPTQVCGPCQYDGRTGWLQQCCRADGTNCSQRPCTPPEECTVQDNRTCLPWPLDSICWGSCTRTCCHYLSSDQYVCGVSPC